MNRHHCNRVMSLDSSVTVSYYSTLNTQRVNVGESRVATKKIKLIGAWLVNSIGLDEGLSDKRAWSRDVYGLPSLRSGRGRK